MPKQDTGSASLMAVALVAVAATLAVALGVVGVVSVAASRAQGAADACALAGASMARDLRALGRSSTRGPCEEAAAVMDEWGMVLEACRVDAEGTVTVTAGVRVAGIWISRTARAGTGWALSSKQNEPPKGGPFVPCEGPGCGTG